MALLDAGRGLGMTPGQLARRVEWPLAIPVAFAGIRTAGVEVIPVSLDIADPSSPEVLRSHLGSRSIRGIVHTAAVFESGDLVDVTSVSLERVLRPKITGAERLAELAGAGVVSARPGSCASCTTRARSSDFFTR